jgi:hypothetical protein
MSEVRLGGGRSGATVVFFICSRGVVVGGRDDAVGMVRQRCGDDDNIYKQATYTQSCTSEVVLTSFILMLTYKG